MSHMNRIESRIATTERAKLRTLRDQIKADVDARDKRERQEMALLRAECEMAPEWRYFLKLPRR